MQGNGASQRKSVYMLSVVQTTMDFSIKLQHIFIQIRVKFMDRKTIDLEIDRVAH